MAGKEFERYLKQIKGKNKIESDEEFEKILEAQGMPIELMRRQQERNFIAMNYLQQRVMTAVDRISRADLEEYYRTRPDEFKVRDSVRWRHMFIAKARYNTPEEAQREAESLAARVRAGEDFVELSRKFCHGDSARRGGEGVGRQRGEIKPVELEERLFRMRPGEVGPVIELRTGYHIFQLVDREYEGQKPFDEKVQKQITDEHSHKGFDGRFGPGLPRVSDGSLLFLLHLVSKMRDPRDGGSRIGIILNGSPLFTGGAGSGESEIRRYLLQNDLVEAIIALPTDMFYNTGIATYVWILSNHKAAARQGKVQLIDGSQHYAKMRKGLGSKRQYITEDQISELVRLYGSFEQTAQSKIFPIDAFGYRRITVERPLRLNFQTSAERIAKVLEEKALQKLDSAAQQQLLAALQAMDASVLHRNREQFSKLLNKALTAHSVSLSTPELKALMSALGERDPEADICMVKGQPEADAGLRDNENVPLGESVHDYFQREVIPHVPGAWIDESKTDALDGEVGIVGFEIPFNRHFYVFQPPRPLAEIDSDLKACTDRIKQMIEGLSA